MYSVRIRSVATACSFVIKIKIKMRKSGCHWIVFKVELLKQQTAVGAQFFENEIYDKYIKVIVTELNLGNNDLSR